LVLPFLLGVSISETGLVLTKAFCGIENFKYAKILQSVENDDNMRLKETSLNFRTSSYRGSASFNKRKKLPNPHFKKTVY
jgi:hypothetical protein